MKKLYFFLGTEAELIKVFPMIMEAKQKGMPFCLIASGQNNVAQSKILKQIDCGFVELELSKESDIRKSAVGLLAWWIKTYLSAVAKIQKAFPEDCFQDGIMVVHGDTISTFMGALIGKKLGMLVCHVEAGLRSHNFFSPFPEEIDRLLTSRIARIHFAPGDLAYSNLKKAKGLVVNTKQNTLLDSLRYSWSVPLSNDAITAVMNESYFVYVMHRQENLVSKSFVYDAVTEILKAAEKRKCVILLHKITENAFVRFGVMKAIKENPNIVTFPRVDYFDFMKLFQNAEFVITDGGSNQEELFYMQKPCLILRTVTERNEGLGVNARLFSGRASDIGTFIDEFECGKIQVGTVGEEKPSQLIIESLMDISALDGAADAAVV